jgi:hypothetical protein
LIQARLRPFHAADNARVPHRGSMGGWDQLRSRLVGQDGRPMIYCFSTHAASIRTIPALQHDPARPEDVNTESEDHGRRVAVCVHVEAVCASACGTHEERARCRIRRTPLYRAG